MATDTELTTQQAADARWPKGELDHRWQVWHTSVPFPVRIWAGSEGEAIERFKLLCGIISESWAGVLVSPVCAARED